MEMNEDKRTKTLGGGQGWKIPFNRCNTNFLSATEAFRTIVIAFQPMAHQITYFDAFDHTDFENDPPPWRWCLGTM